MHDADWRRRSVLGRGLFVAPHVLTGLRLVSAVLLWWLVTRLHLWTAFACLAFAALTDATDGPLVRRFGVPSRAGAYFDVIADFAVIFAAFAAFAAIGVYPAWLAALIAFVFAAFLLSSRLTPAIYDPVGRHIGGVLFVAVAATLLFPDLMVQQVILWTVTGALAATLAARAFYLVRRLSP